MKNKTIILAIVAMFVVAIGVGAFFGLNSGSGGSSIQVPVTASSSSAVESAGLGGYSGKLIAGSTTPYLRYNKADFDKARGEGKAIYIYVYATWCPICAAERPSIFGAFNELNSSSVVGFETHWIDGQDNDEDHDLQRTFGVAQQHTHIFLEKDGSVAEKIFTPISKDEIKSKILNIA